MSDERSSLISASVGLNGYMCLYVTLVNKANNGNKKTAKIFLVIANSFIAFWTDDKVPKESKTFYWVDIISARIDDDLFTFEFAQSGKMEFVSDEAKRIKNIIGSLLNRFFSAKQRAHCDISDFGTFSSFPNGLTMIARFMSFAGLNKLKITERIAAATSEVFKYRYPEFIIKEPDDIGNCLGAFLSAIRVINFVNSITIPDKINPSFFKTFSTLLKRDTAITHFHIFESNLSGFADFCDFLKTSPNKYLTGLSFNGQEFKEKNLKKLHECVVGKKLISLSLQKCLKENLMKYFMEKFLDDDFFSSIVMLNVDYTKSLNIETLFTKIQPLTSLSLESCDIDIYNVFSLIGKYNLTNLKLLNLSYNRCDKAFNDAELPSQCPLLRLDLRGVVWENGTFSGLFAYIQKSKWKEGLMLDVSYSDITEEDFDDCMSFVAKAKKSPLLHLCWANIPLTKKMLKYIAKAPKLFSLDISNCLVKEDTSVISELGDFINGSSMLRFLTMKGSDDVRIESSFSVFLERLTHPKALGWLDVRNQCIGNEGLNGIISLIKRTPTLQTIGFSKSGIIEYKQLYNFIKAVKSLHRYVQLDWPTDDINNISSENPVKGEDILELKKLLCKINSHGNTTNFTVNEDLADDPFERPFDAFKIIMKDSFPLYITENLRQSMEHPVPPIPVAKTISHDDVPEEEEVNEKKHKHHHHHHHKKDKKKDKKKHRRTTFVEEEEENIEMKTPQQTEVEETIIPPSPIHSPQKTQPQQQQYPPQMYPYPPQFPYPYIYPFPPYPFMNQQTSHHLYEYPSPVRESRMMRPAPIFNDSDDDKYQRKQPINKPSWEFPIDKVSKPDEKAVVEEIDEKFSFKNLATEIQKI